MMLMEQTQFLNGVNRKGDKAWKELYRYFYAPLCSYSVKITGDADAAEDIVQGCLVRLWRSSIIFTDSRHRSIFIKRGLIICKYRKRKACMLLWRRRRLLAFM